MSNFDSNGNYNKTNWKTGDKITADKLNKIEDSLEVINNNDMSRHEEVNDKIDEIKEENVAWKNEVEERVREPLERAVWELKQVAIFVDSMDGSDDEKIEKAIINAGKFGVVKFNKREYLLTKSITPLEGQIFEGVSSGLDNGTIINIENDSYIFDFQVGLGTREVVPPSYKNITFKCNNGIRHGKEELFLPTDSVDSQNYIMHGFIKNCYFIGRDQTGNAIELIGQYRTPITENYISGYNVGIRTVGCDLNEIHLNRIWICKKALMEILSLGSGGTQTKIIKNDLLAMTGKTKSEAMIISSDMNPIIEDNYFENGGCDSVIKILNGNNGGHLQTISIINNRVEIDASQVNYFLNTPDNFNFLCLNVKNNSSRKGTNGFLRNNKFDENGTLLSLGTSGLPRLIYWENSPNLGVPFTIKNTISECEVITTSTPLRTTNGPTTHRLRAFNNCFVLDSTHTDTWLEPSKTMSGQFDISITLKGNAGDKIAVQPRSGDSYINQYNIILTDGFKTHTFKNLNRDNLRFVLVTDSNNTGNVFIEKIVIRESEVKVLENKTFTGSSFTYDLSSYNEDLYIILQFSASTMFTGQKTYLLRKLIDGSKNKVYKAQLLDELVFSSSVINANAEVSNNIITINVTGNGGEKVVNMIIKNGR